MVEIGHFPQWPPTEIRRPCNSSSHTLSTVPALPSVRTTALPTSSDCAASKAPRIVEARSFTGGIIVSKFRCGPRIVAVDLVCQTVPLERHHQSLIAPRNGNIEGPSEQLALPGVDPALCRRDHGCSPLNRGSMPRAPSSTATGDRINLLRLYVENATRWNLDGRGQELH